ncbi:hypothetical protein [Shouchella lonarensis]|uniref:Uncharacterized protein n=1 Tax=Shouchella lonarensis TaxID=1464122 RepID=A0A1G6MJ12_9BACI|nr:hypothetical protein [Shouchella lonarensis]SDC55522.1 hypothetical protein SAMN05421737_11042 [Shouchella lonarensis]
MKIEMGESLVYSWLRHVKECQVVQMNWKSSSTWKLQDEDNLKQLMEMASEHFQNEYCYSLYKNKNKNKNNSFAQFLKQAEMDAVGICITENGMEVHTVDVAFHKDGLHYDGGRQETIIKVIKKLIRSAMCMISYFRATTGEVIFASPKIHNAVMKDLEPCMIDLNNLFLENGYGLTARVIANDEFNELMLKPVLIASNNISDTSELFVRSYQLVSMFGDERSTWQRDTKPTDASVVSNDTLSEFKVGKIAQIFLREALESGKADDEEVSLMLTKDYSKSTFGINFPLLVPVEEECDLSRYYTKKPLVIRNKKYWLCSQWFESPANNDRPSLLAWLDKRGAVI